MTTRELYLLINRKYLNNYLTNKNIDVMFKVCRLNGFWESKLDGRIRLGDFIWMDSGEEDARGVVHENGFAEIRIDSTLYKAQKITTLIHEMGHLIQHLEGLPLSEGAALAATLIKHGVPRRMSWKSAMLC